MSSMKDWTTARVSKNVRRQAKRLEMLRAAARLFSDHGFHETSLDKLSDAIGAKKPTLYHYLGNKEQMVFECLKRSEEHTSELQSLLRFSYAVFCLNKTTT